MHYEERFTDAELDLVIAQGMIYMCACPAQVADGMRKLREMLRYQMRCLDNPNNDNRVHTNIARHVVEAHEAMQRCLDGVIVLENWDRATLEMPAELRTRQMREILSDD